MDRNREIESLNPSPLVFDLQERATTRNANDCSQHIEIKDLRKHFLQCGTKTATNTPTAQTFDIRRSCCFYYSNFDHVAKRALLKKY